jgi:hypothetical protein
MYAIQFLGLAAMAFAKTSVAILSRRVLARPHLFSSAILSVIAGWVLFSCFVVAFPCHLPRPWIYIPSQCSTLSKLLYPVIVFNIVTDALLAFWLIPFVSRLNIPLKKRLSVCCLFGVRLMSDAYPLI